MIFFRREGEYSQYFISLRTENLTATYLVPSYFYIFSVPREVEEAFPLCSIGRESLKLLATRANTCNPIQIIFLLYFM